MSGDYGANCRLCAIRKLNKMSPCAACIAKPAQRATIAEREPLPAEAFNPQDVLETSIRQARAIQRQLQESIDERSDVEQLSKLHASLAKSISAIIPAWQKLRDGDKASGQDVTTEEEEDLFVSWFTKLVPSRQREVWQRLARGMNGEKEQG